MKTEERERRLQTNERRQPPEAGGDKERILRLNLQRENGPADTLILNFYLQDCEEINFCCFKPHCL